MIKLNIIKRFSEIGNIFRIEFKSIFQNKTAILIFFAATIMYPLLYSYTYNNEVLRDIHVAVVDNDNSDMSRKYIQMCDAHENIIVAKRCFDLEQAKKLFREEKVHGIISIPDDFSKKIYKKEQVNVSIYCDGSYFLMYKQFAKAAIYTNKTFCAGIQIKGYMLKGSTEKEAFAKSFPIQYTAITLYNPADGYASYAIPAVLLLIIQQTLLMGIGVLSGYYNEKKKLHFLLPFSEMKFRGSSVVIGKALVYFLLYIFHLFYVLVIIFKLFNFPNKGEMLDVILFIIPFMLSVIFLGLTISVFFKAKENAIMILSFTSLPFLLLSGISWPLESMPSAIVNFAKVLPSSFGVSGFIKINQMGATLWEVKEIWYSLWIQCGIYFVTAALGFRYLIAKVVRVK
jgi:ABC-2 type transport system permease protein